MYLNIFALVSALMCTVLDDLDLVPLQDLIDLDIYYGASSPTHTVTSNESLFEQTASEIFAQNLETSNIESSQTFQKHVSQNSNLLEFYQNSYPGQNYHPNMSQYSNTPDVSFESRTESTPKRSKQEVDSFYSQQAPNYTNYLYENVLLMPQSAQTASDSTIKDSKSTLGHKRPFDHLEQSITTFLSLTDQQIQAHFTDFARNESTPETSFFIPCDESFEGPSCKEKRLKLTNNFSENDSDCLNNLYPTNYEDTSLITTNSWFKGVEVSNVEQTTEQVECSNQVDVSPYKYLIFNDVLITKSNNLADSVRPTNDIPILNDAATDLDLYKTDLKGYTYNFLKRFEVVISSLDLELDLYLVPLTEMLGSSIMYSNNFKILPEFSRDLFDLFSVQNTTRVIAMSTTADVLIQFFNNLNLDSKSQIVTLLSKALNSSKVNSNMPAQVPDFISQIDYLALEEIRCYLNSDESCWLKSCAPGFYSFVRYISDIQLNSKGDFTRSFLCFLIMLKRNYVLLPKMIENLKITKHTLQKDLIFRENVENNIPFFFVFLHFLPLKYEKGIVLEKLKGALWSSIYFNEGMPKNAKNITDITKSRFSVLNTLFYHGNLLLYPYTKEYSLDRTISFCHPIEYLSKNDEFNALYSALNEEIKFRFSYLNACKYKRLLITLEMNFKSCKHTLTTLDKLLYYLNTLVYYKPKTNFSLEPFYLDKIYNYKYFCESKE